MKCQYNLLSIAIAVSGFSWSTVTLAAPDLMTSQTGKREYLEPLSGQHIGANRTLLIALDNLELNGQQPSVTWFVDGEQVNQVVYSTAPFDIVLSENPDNPATFNSDLLSPGSHTIEAHIDFPAGPDEVVTATFIKDDVLPEHTAGAAYDFSEVETLLDAAMISENLNGISLIIMDKENGFVFESYRGAFNPSRISLLASASKTLSAGILSKLAEQGLLDLDAPLASLPEVPWGAANPTITTAQLLSNSSGLPGLGEDFEFHSCQVNETDSLLACGEAIFTATTDDDIQIPPDTEYHYGGIQWQVAGAVAEAVSGKSWQQLLDETYIGPCGLSSLGFGNPFELLRDQSGVNQSNGIFSLVYPRNFFSDPDNLTPTVNPNIEGGVFSNAPDYAKLLLMQLNGGTCDGLPVLSQSSLKQMTSDRIGAAYNGISHEDSGYGLGWFVERDGSGVVFDPGLFGSVAWMDLNDGYGAFMVLEKDDASSKRIWSVLEPLVDSIMAEAEVNNGGATDNPMVFEIIDNLFIDHNVSAVVLEHSFNTQPLIFAEMQTQTGSDTADVRVKHVDLTGFDAELEEESSKDNETDHAAERVGALVLEEGLIKDNSGNVIGETGVIHNVKQPDADTWFNQAFNNTYIDPIVIVKLNTKKGGSPAHIRLKSVTPSDFTYKVEEWKYQDGSHHAEDLAYIVIETGVHDLNNGKTIQALKTEADHEFTDVNFVQAFSSLPVVLSQSQTRIGTAPIVTRMTNITNDRLSLRVQEEEKADGTHAIETIGVIGISQQY